MSITEKYLKIRFKNRGPPCYFLEAKRSKILQKLNKRDYFSNILGFIFYGVSHAKPDLSSKYIFNFVFGSFFEQDHLLNLLILGVYAQRWPKVQVIENRNWGPFHKKEFKWKKMYGGTGLVSEKTEALYVEPNERVEATTSSYSTTGEFLRYIYSVSVAKNHQRIRSKC